MNWDMLGHEWAVNLLQEHLIQDRVRHAYLITGPQGVGRRTLSLRMAQGLNCPEPTAPGVPCRTCRTCQRIEKMQHPDLAVVQAEEIGGTMKVDQVRELLRMLSLAPYEARYRVALFLRFEEANPNAANALLKTLEEPPPQVVIILTALDAESLLPTIVSRCEVLRLRPLSGDIVAKGLCEQWGVPPDQAYLLAQVSGGRPGYALYLHNNPDAQEERQTQLDEHQEMLSASYVDRFAFADKLSKDKPRLRNTLQTWTSLWRDVMLRAAESSTPITNPDRKDEIDQLAAEIDLSTAQTMVSTLERMIRLIDKNVNPRLVAEVTVLDLPRLA